jgi:hypothetical protein
MFKHVAYCDRCGEKVPDGLRRIGALGPYQRQTAEDDSDFVEHVDLCPACALDRLQVEVSAKSLEQARDWVKAARYKVKPAGGG